MNVLAFDTCLGAVSAAVRWRGARGWLVREAYEPRRAGHADRLVPMIAEVMESAGVSFAALDRIAVTLGPGGFTGVRAGVSAARALALATGKPVTAATSLSVMAHRAGELLGGLQGKNRLVVAVDAGRGVLYAQSFTAGGRATSEASAMTPEEAARWIGAGGALVVGSAAPALAALVREAGGDAEARLPDLEPHARSLAALAPELAPVARVSPLYLRAPDVHIPADAPLLV